MTVEQAPLERVVAARMAEDADELTLWPYVLTLECGHEVKRPTMLRWSRCEYCREREAEGKLKSTPFRCSE